MSGCLPLIKSSVEDWYLPSYASRLWAFFTCSQSAGC